MSILLGVDDPQCGFILERKRHRLKWIRRFPSFVFTLCSDKDKIELSLSLQYNCTPKILISVPRSLNRFNTRFTVKNSATKYLIVSAAVFNLGIKCNDMSNVCLSIVVHIVIVTLGFTPQMFT